MSHFCCCLPLRLGTLLIAFFQFAINAAAAIVVWLVLFASHIPKSWWNIGGNEIQPPEIYMTTAQKIFTIASGVVLSLGAIFSLIGFIGALTRRISFVRGFAHILVWLLGFHLGTGIANTVLWAVNKKNYVNRCITELSSHPDLKDVQDDACAIAHRAVLIALIIAVVVPFLFDLYAFVIVRQYSEELEHKAYSKTAFNLTAPVDMSYKYAPAGTKEDGASVPLTHDQYSQPYSASYPYAQQHNSYGGSYNTPYSK